MPEPPPLIGLTTYRDVIDLPVAGPTDITFVPSLHLEILWSLGARAVVLGASPADTAHPGPLLSLIDGLLLVDGGDVDPVQYGQRPHPRTSWTSLPRDAFEISLARHAVEGGMPVFGVCRGAQLLNVALGGSLEQHLPDRFPQGPHGSEDTSPRGHDVRLRPNSLLSGIYGSQDVLNVFSQHHQAVAEVAAGLQPVAWSDDGSVEAVEAPTGFTLGLQWHPEETAREDPLHVRPYAAFVEAATRYRQGWPEAEAAHHTG